jgi:hypothetical protein
MMITIAIAVAITTIVVWLRPITIGIVAVTIFIFHLLFTFIGLNLAVCTVFYQWLTAPRVRRKFLDAVPIIDDAPVLGNVVDISVYRHKDMFVINYGGMIIGPFDSYDAAEKFCDERRLKGTPILFVQSPGSWGRHAQEE